MILLHLEDLDDCFSQSYRVVASLGLKTEERIEVRGDVKLSNRGLIDGNRFRSFVAISFDHVFGNQLTVEKSSMKESFSPTMRHQRLQVLGSTEVIRFAGLRHQVSHVDPNGRGLHQCVLELLD